MVGFVLKEEILINLFRSVLELLERIDSPSHGVDGSSPTFTQLSPPLRMRLVRSPVVVQLA